jgi:hypothetical protein
MNEQALLLMREYGIEQVVIVDPDTITADTVDAHTITSADVATDEEAATIVAAVIARCEPARLLAVAPTLVVSAPHVARVVAEL